MDPHNDQLTVGLTAQLVEDFTSIADVRVQVVSLTYTCISLATA